MGIEKKKNALSPHHIASSYCILKGDRKGDRQFSFFFFISTTFFFLFFLSLFLLSPHFVRGNIRPKQKYLLPCRKQSRDASIGGK